MHLQRKSPTYMFLIDGPGEQAHYHTNQQREREQKAGKIQIMEVLYNT